LAGRRILCPRADIAPEDLVCALADSGALVSSVDAYRTVPEDDGAERVGKMLAEDAIDWITFTSSSTVRSFFAVVGPQSVRACSARLASIGPVTSQSLKEAGFTPHAEATKHTVDGLLDAIIDAEQSAEVGT
ncbi:MAG: uroporphyrinogen-III synthase, partial [Planctomycetota bacterium]